MRKLIAGCAVTAVLALPVAGYPSTESDIAELKAMFMEMKSDYESRIAELENRLEAAEKRAVQAEKKSEAATKRSVAAEKRADKATQRVVALDQKVEATPAPMPAEPTPKTNAVSSTSAFNPQMSVILDGNYYNDGLGGEGATLVGRSLPAWHGSWPRT